MATSGVFAVYGDERDAVDAAIRLARELRKTVAVVCRFYPEGEVYRLTSSAFEDDAWSRCGVAYPSGQYHG